VEGKVCKGCNEFKSFGDFYKAKNFKDGYNSKCKQCLYTPRPDKIIRDEKGKVCTKCNQYKTYDNFSKSYNQNKDGYRNDCRECRNALNKKNYDTERNNRNCAKWAKENPKKRNAIYYKKGIKRRSYKQKVNFKPHERIEILKRDNWTCQCCGIKVHDEKISNETKAHIDHIIPISKGGHSEPFNLQTLCRTCNLSKSDKVIV
jgi:5-methylcytosine-specific restriction endonuclease McrA